MRKQPPSIKPGDSVEWNTSQGSTQGKVEKEITRPAKAGGHRAKASREEPQYEVRSDKSGKTAIHKPEALKKIQEKAQN
jgi:hypothetical protein